MEGTNLWTLFYKQIQVSQIIFFSSIVGIPPVSKMEDAYDVIITNYQRIKDHDLKDFGFFIAGSSEDLILCGQSHMIYRVCNPLTKQWLRLPKPNL